MNKFILFLILLSLTFCQSNSRKPDEENMNNKSEEKSAVENQLDELLSVSENEQLLVSIKTNMGEMKLALFPDKAPKTVRNFVGLILRKYYDGIIFHRVIANFMIQGGDPSGTGAGGESFFGGEFEDEFHPSLKHDKPGILSMANAGPNTNGSQFFITLVPTPWLNGRHSIFGTLVEGMDVLNKIGATETSKPYDKPVNDVVMESVTVAKFSK